jgi:hypothetical protein
MIKQSLRTIEPETLPPKHGAEHERRADGETTGDFARDGTRRRSADGIEFAKRGSILGRFPAPQSLDSLLRRDPL